MATQILSKINQYYSTSSTQSLPLSSSPNEWFNTIITQLNEWLLIIPNFFNSIFTKLGEIFSKENLAHFLEVSKPYLLATLGVVLLCLFCFCLLPAILSCLVGIVVAIWSFIVWFFLFLWSLIRGLFMLIWSVIRGLFMGISNICKTMFGKFCCCFKGSGRMMKAPGTGGKLIIERSRFEGNPRAYFRNLRAGRPV